MLGLNQRLIDVFVCFYSKISVRFYARGGCSKQSYSRTRGILQGCPWSAMILVAIMSCFVAAAEQECPSVKWGVFIDDRLAWCTEVGALEKAAKFVVWFDECCHFIINRGKGTCFALDHDQREVISSSNHCCVIGSMSTCITHLGAEYPVERIMGSTHYVPMRDKTRSKLKAQIDLRLQNPDVT